MSDASLKGPQRQQAGSYKYPERPASKPVFLSPEKTYARFTAESHTEK
ncbi:hypothetical protein [Pseudomonas batumici]|nr:hypothetical protein [Pseudomonas batumici]